MGPIEIKPDIVLPPKIYFDPWCENPILYCEKDKIKMTQKQWIQLANVILEEFDETKSLDRKIE